MDVGPETEKRLKIANDLGSKVKGIVRGFILGGSMGFGQNFSIRETSDIDAVIICDKERIDELLEIDYFIDQIDSDVINLFKKGSINLFWVTKYIDGIEVNVFVYETKGYEDFLFMRGDLKGYLKERPLEVIKDYGFDGILINIDRNVTPYGNGFLYEKPTLYSGKFWGGVPRQDFLYSGYVINEEDNYLTDLGMKVWEATIKKLKDEHGPKVDLERFNVLNTHWVYHKERSRIPDSVIEKIRKRTKDELEKL